MPSLADVFALVPKGCANVFEESNGFNQITPFSSKTGLKERSVLLRGKGRSCSIQESSSPKTSLCTTLKSAATVLFCEHLCLPLQMFSLLCRKDAQMCLRKATVSIRSPHSENLGEADPATNVSRILITRTVLVAESAGFLLEAIYDH